MQILQIKVLNPQAKCILRGLASCNPIAVVPKRKTAEKEKKRTPLEEFDDICRGLREYQQKIGFVDTMTEDEICEDIREYRREKYAKEHAH
ncbi:MAG: hypothetical protein LBN39_04060 [Planctomycetaceae bacterium]|jgi:hypothetical protein|nr:hypothetical protein [Planctomycetaceae bacterium]